MQKVINIHVSLMQTIYIKQMLCLVTHIILDMIYS